MTGADVTSGTGDAVVDPVDAEPRTLAAALVAIVAVAAYTAVVGVRSAAALAVVVAGAGLLLGAPAWRRWRRAGEVATVGAQPAIRLAAAVGGPLLIAVHAVGVLDGSAVPLGIVLGLQVVTGAYVLPPSRRLPLQVYAIVVWAGAVLIAPGGGATVALGHLIGGAALAVTVNRTADAQLARRERERASRTHAEALMRLLASVQQVNDLEPQAVLDAVLRGLRDLDLAVVEVRRIDEDAQTARLEVAATATGEDPPAEIPFERPLLAQLLAEWRTLVVEDFQGDPRTIQKDLGYQASMAVPLSLGAGGRGVLAVASLDGPLTSLQREATELLADHAARALERASGFEADARIVADLQRLDARTHDFVSTASHELRTPLTVISGLGQTLRAHWSELDEARRDDLLHRIDANAERLATMVRHLLDTSALDRGELRPDVQPVRLRDAVERMLDRLVTVTAAYPIRVEVADDLAVQVDPGLFEHVLENLVTNVSRHTPQGTPVVVSGEAHGDRVRIAVRDEGPGIAPEDLPHVLDRFYRGGDIDRRPSGGLGLGLALSQQIVRAHGGELDVDSGQGRGTTFSFDVASG